VQKTKWRKIRTAICSISAPTLRIITENRSWAHLRSLPGSMLWPFAWVKWSRNAPLATCLEHGTRRWCKNVQTAHCTHCTHHESSITCLYKVHGFKKNCASISFSRHWYHWLFMIIPSFLMLKKMLSVSSSILLAPRHAR
jgi:hypothetical protein